MPTDRTPLLADTRRTVSDDSDRRAEEEDEALHGKPERGAPWGARLREILIFAWAVLATAAVIILAVWMQHQHEASNEGKPSGKRNLIFMVSDGMGPASLSLTRSFRQRLENLEYNDTLVLDKHFWGTSRTRSTSSLVTDSAAGATAFACGLKSYNGAISMLPDYSPCGTVLEAAKRAGYATGLVVTTDITDATPACFASHVYLRQQEDEIALQEIGEGPLGRVLDLMFGGGRCHFLPNTTEGSCREDDVNVVELAQQKHGWTYADSRAGFDEFSEGKNVTLPALGLFANTDVPFEIDRRTMADIYPSLSEMAIAALAALEKATEDSDQGFFLMIEGSRIDHAGHINDPAAQVREVLEYDKTFKAVLDFIEGSKVDGVLVATSDHETGGLATALQKPTDSLPVYNWHPTPLIKASASAERCSQLYHAHVDATGDVGKKLRDWVNVNLVQEKLGINDASDSELDEILAEGASASQGFAGLVSRRARIGWSSHGHSAVDVNIYSSGGYGTNKIRGNVENTDVGKFLREYLAVDVEDITRELKENLNVKRPMSKKKHHHKKPKPPGTDNVDMEDLPLDLVIEQDIGSVV